MTGIRPMLLEHRLRPRDQNHRLTMISPQRRPLPPMLQIEANRTGTFLLRTNHKPRSHVQDRRPNQMPAKAAHEKRFVPGSHFRV